MTPKDYAMIAEVVVIVIVLLVARSRAIDRDEIYQRWVKTHDGRAEAMKTVDRLNKDNFRLRKELAVLTGQPVPVEAPAEVTQAVYDPDGALAYEGAPALREWANPEPDRVVDNTIKTEAVERPQARYDTRFEVHWTEDGKDCADLFTTKAEAIAFRNVKRTIDPFAKFNEK